MSQNLIQSKHGGKEKMNNVDSQDLKKKMGKGVFSLTLRSIIVNVLQVISSLILANFLAPKDYGIFGIFSGWIGTLAFFTDFGVGQTLVLQKEELKLNQVSTYLGIRLVLSLAMVVLFALAFPFILNYYDIQFQNSYWITLYGLVLIFDVLSSIPRLYFHKELEFSKIAKLDLFASIVLYTIQISLAILGFGFWIFFIAALSRSIFSLFFSYILLKKKFILPKISLEVFKGKYWFSLKYHLNGLIPVSKSIFLPLVMAINISVEELGLIFWLTNMVSLPKQIFYNYNHVIFASMSKIAHLSDDYKKVATQISSAAVFFVFVVFSLGAYLGPILIQTLFNEKFHPASDYIHLCSLAIGLATLEYIHIPILSSTGKPGLINRSQVASVFLDLSFTFVFSYYFGLKGYFYGQILLFSITVLILNSYCRKYFDSLFYKRVFFILSAIVITILIPTNDNIWMYALIKISTSLILLTIYIILFDRNLVKGILNQLTSKSSTIS